MPLIISGGGSASTVTWANVTGKPTTLANFDVNATDIADGKILQWDATESEWVYVENSGGTVDTTPTEDSTNAISSDWAYDHENSGMTSGTAHVPDNTSAADGAFLAKDGTWQVPSGTGTGEANGGINIGTAGVGIFDSKSGVNLQFKKINAGSNKVTITDDTANSEVDIDIDVSKFIYDEVDSSSTVLALSANQGKVLDEAKADKVGTATNNNFASFDSTGNIQDSGHSDADYADSSHNHTASEITDFDTEVTNNTTVAGKADVIGTPTENNLIKQDASGNNADAGVAINDSGTTTSDLWTANKINTELGNKVSYDINGQTELAEAPADADEVGIYDTDATALKKVTFSNLKAGVVNNSITDGNTTTAPSEDAVHAALANKEDTLNANQKRTITVGTGDPSGGSDGDIYIKYTA